MSAEGFGPGFLDIHNPWLSPSYGFDGATKKITTVVRVGTTPEGNKVWKKVTVTVPKDVSKNPPPAFPHKDDPGQMPLPTPKAK